MDEREEIVVTGRRVARGFLWMGAAQLLLGLLFGLLVGLHYTPFASTLNGIGLRLTALRPLHTGATVGWIFFAGMAMVYRWMFEHLADRFTAGEPGAAQIAKGVARRAELQRWVWGCVAVIAAIALASGYSTGRQYLEYPPILSIPIVVGWLMYAVNFALVTRFRLREMPVYAWMWGTSVFLFLWTFAEAHAWLLDALASRPVRDLAIQWKAAGALVGSFNLLVYGSVSWLGTRLSGDDR
jgi:nitric oxide reductase subunit B